MRRLTDSRFLSVLAVAALIGSTGVACDAAGSGLGATTSPPAATSQATSSSTKPTATTDDEADVDYSALLLQANDVSTADDTFHVQSSNPGPDGLPGASVLLVNHDDTRAISDTIVIYPDAATATRTLREALPSIDQVVAGATPQPVPVGVDGTLARGTSPDGTKSATLLLFTHGPALVRLEFQSALGDSATDEYVLAVGKMQDIALRHGLPGQS
ncbi:hypothetical protein [Mycolicibacterium phlei]|uniref:hypothetical protein n=1 Tax=Mycolicibacterium phlei TaxID=1771 RepID=UPI00025ADE5B|nr:hypothetical protein [Mycolicibacterium phlei]EID13642.1 hypothetical protein MPHLEI_12796 [Mycolicibacterium phlei RIVM601174]MBF4195313.1 hypothetical protein [Mycolicibacterium phlei]